MRIHGEQVFVDGLFNADPHPGNVMLLGVQVALGASFISVGPVIYLGQFVRWLLRPASATALLRVSTRLTSSHISFPRTACWLMICSEFYSFEASRCSR